MSAPGSSGRGILFAETQLRRHGWRRGRGLGRREDGIAEAIRVKVKCDTAGVGHDAAEPFTFHWWDHIFNKAAANIAVEAGQDGISVKALSEQEGGISNKKPRKASKSGSLLYGRFVKSATLTACGEESVTLPTGSESSEEEEKLDLSSVRRLTEEELVQACGGRTAHKGARHGLTMSAKLARLEEQERAFLATYQHQEQQQEPLESRQGKKKKRKQSRDGANPEVPQSEEPKREQEEVLEKEKVVKRKKKKNQGSSREGELMGEEDVTRKKMEVTESCVEEEVSGEERKVMKRRKKKKKKKKKPEPSREKEVVKEEGKAAKRKKEQEEEDKEEQAETDIPLEDTDGPDLGHSPTMKRKKKRKKREPE